MDTSHMYFPVSPPNSVRVAYKQSARAHARARANRRPVNLVAMPTEKQTLYPCANLSTDTFRSPRVLEDVDQVEKSHSSVLLHQRPRLTPEQAIIQLRHAVLAATSGKNPCFDAVAAQNMLNGLESACWQSFIPQNGPKTDEKPQILYSQLLRGTEDILREEQVECQQLRDKIQQLEERNNNLPQMIQDCQTAVARAMESAVRGDSQLQQKPTDVSATTATIREELTKMRRRKDLRTFACNELRAGLNELLTRRSELKQLVSAAISDVKKEEQANKLRAKRLDDLRTLTTAASLLPTGRGGCKTSTQQQLARLTFALAKNHVLQEARTERKTFVRNRTEAIFDVRIALRELNDERISVQNELQTLEQQAADLQRVSTPRPDWSELHDATVVTTAVDRADPSARLRMGATRKFAGEKAADVDEDRANEQRLTQILASNWSTIAKVGAMAAELAQIRSADHTSATISAEQKKLQHLRKEIARLMQQLEAVKAQSVQI